MSIKAVEEQGVVNDGRRVGNTRKNESLAMAIGTKEGKRSLSTEGESDHFYILGTKPPRRTNRWINKEQRVRSRATTETND